MIHPVHIDPARRIFVLFCVGTVLMLGAADEAGAIARRPLDHPAYADAGTHLFNGELTSIHVIMDPADLAALLADPWSDEFKLCSVHLVNSVIDETYADVAIRVRGNTSRNAIKKSWKLSFNTYVPGRKVHGLEKLNVNGVHNDPSIIRHRLASDLYNRLSVPSSRAQHVRLRINDGVLVEGVYILVEHIDEQFVDAWFGNDVGSLYEGANRNGDAADLRFVAPGAPWTYMDLGEGETYREKLHATPDFFDLTDFIAFVTNVDAVTFAAEINHAFNVDSFLRVLAVDATIGNWDAFWWGKNNYYLYHDADTGRFEYIPYDLDNTYGVDFAHTDWSTRPHLDWGVAPWGESPPLVERILAIPAYAEQYQRYLRQLIEAGSGPFTLAVSGPRIDAMRAMIEPYAYAGSFAGGQMDWGYTQQNFATSYTWPGNYRDWPSGWDHGLKPYIEDRVLFLATDVPTPPSLPSVRVNELVASNQSGLQDEMGEYEDWVELYNAGPATVDLGGMYLTDNPGNPTRWMIPPGQWIAAGEYLVFWCDEEPLEGPLHAGFKLDDDGEGVGLFDSDAAGIVLIDFVEYPELVPDVSYGRTPDGGAQIGYLATPTPGASNAGFGNVPPLLSQTRHSPASPGAGEAVTITSWLRDLDGEVAGGTLFYDAGAGFVDVEMFDDGLHGDGEAGDGIFGAQVPGQPGGSSVSYYVEARDDQGAVATDPAGAPTVTHTFVIGFVPPPLFVNEFLASNSTVIVDEFGEYDDWLEIYNAGTVPIDLAGLGLSDDLSDPTRFVFPAIPAVVLPPGGYLLVWCDSQPSQGPLHADFRLAVAGEQVGLFATGVHGWAPIDTLTYGPQTADVSYGREPDGGSVWTLFEPPTPGWQNGLLIGIGEAGAAPVPVLHLGPARPHPLAAAGGRIDFSLARAGAVTLRVYDVGGRHRRTLIDATLSAGPHDVGWDGRDAVGRRLAAGVYFLRLDTGGDARSRRIVIAW